MSRVDIDTDPTAYLTGPVAGEAAKTEGGTTRDSGVATFGSSRDGSESTSAGTFDRISGEQTGGEVNAGKTQKQDS